ncbi:MAG TPA: EamA family transporter [Gemmatimonadales bacterium]|nr:EamA family transporter [Gemmatimonadales bacterium]
MPSGGSSQRAWRVAAAFAAIYAIWGSTYLAIRVAIETLPPFLMAGVRFLIAGTVLHLLGRLRGDAAPKAAHIAPSILLGALFFLVGNGGVVWAEQRVPSGLAALMVAVTPLWTTLFEWRGGGRAPSPWTGVGLVAGLAGVGMLVAPGELAPGRAALGGAVDVAGAAACMLSSLGWSFASVLSGGLRLPRSPAIASSLQMLAGGVLLVAAGLATGEGAHVAAHGFSLRSGLALGYLVVFGSLVAFTAFTWLLRVTSPSRVATCAYVNPVVAVFLGWALAGERLTPRVLVAAAVIIGAVVLIISTRRRGDEKGRGGEPEPTASPLPSGRPAA